MYAVAFPHVNNTRDCLEQINSGMEQSHKCIIRSQHKRINVFAIEGTTNKWQ